MGVKKKDGIYIVVVGVMVGRGKWYLLCFRWGLVSFFFFLVFYGYCVGGARGVMVIVVANGHGDTSSNPGRD